MNAKDTAPTVAPIYDAQGAYDAIKAIEGLDQIPYPEPSITVPVGTFDGATGKFTFSIETQTEYFTLSGTGPTHGPHQPDGSIAITVGYVLVYAMDLQLTFSVVNAGPSFTVSLVGQTVSINTGGTLTVDLGGYLTPYQLPTDVPGTAVQLSTGSKTLDIQIRIQRPPCGVAGCFTIPALPTAIVYAPPPGPDMKNVAAYSTSTTISNTISTSVSNGTSTKTATAYSTTDFIDKISGFTGDIANFIAGLLAPGIKTPAVTSAAAPASPASGSSTQTDNTINDIKSVASGIKLVQDILDGFVASNTQNTTDLTTNTTSNTLVTTDTTTFLQGTQPGLGPGVGDRIGFLLNVTVAWAIIDGELNFTVLGYDGIRSYAVATLNSDLTTLLAGTSEPIETGLDIPTLQNLLKLDPLVQNASADVLFPPRFVANIPASIGGSGNDATGDVFTVIHSVVSTDTTATSEVTTMVKDSKPGWLTALLGIDDNTSTETVTTMTYTSGVANSVGQTITSTLTLFASASEKPNMISLYFDTLFGTFVFLPFMSPEPPISTVINLVGIWASGGVAGPVISVSGNSISIDMSAYNRPTAKGLVTDSSHITVDFSDDTTFTATLQLPNTILWSNGSSWTSTVGLTTVIDLNGRWESGGAPGPLITVSGEAISVDMGYAGRPTATGSITDASDIVITFPDDKTYTAKLQLPGTILWSNNSTWTKV